ncbi:MAG: aminotransferase class I/II-fold pyridoxal phosphate-dependent enzyme [Rhodobacterales bacterium]|nr:aminotransferase class I/II-fold pyridoxal phosphate-dependent enzyme [Rhodobacterales bacterium]
MNISHRISEIIGTGSDGWDHFRRARAMKNAGQPVVELTIGEHDTRTDPVILAAMYEAAKAGHTGYASIPGIPALRAAIAERITRESGVPTGPDNVMVTAGGQSALFAAHHAACDEGDRALFIDPYYATYPGTIRAVGAVPVAILAHAEDGFQPRAADIAAVAAGAKSLMINTPNNPTGVIYSRNTLEGIAKVCKDNNLWLISDEVYDTQVWAGAHLSPRTLPGMAERTFTIGSMSKSHAMTGCRIGWICGPADTIGPMTDLATHTNYGIPGFIQDAALFALSLGPDFERSIGAPFNRRRAISLEILAQQNVVRYAPLDGAMYTMLDIRATAMTGEAFAAALLDEEMIAVMPGESFGQAAGGHIRVAMTVADEQYADALRRLIDFAARKARTAD